MMRKPVLCLLSLLALLAWPPPAQAGDPPRYSMTPVEEGALRLDGRTGAVSLCRAYDAGWACEAVPDAHLDLQREVERLREENAALRKERGELRAEIERLESEARQREEADPAAKKQDRITPEGESSASGPAPGEETIEEMMTVLEKMVDRFREMLESLKKHPSEKQL